MKTIKELLKDTDLENEICNNDYKNIYKKEDSLKSKINPERLKKEIEQSLSEKSVINLTCNLIGFFNIIAHKVKESYLDEKRLINKNTLDGIERKINEILRKKSINKYYNYDSRELINSLKNLSDDEYMKIKNNNIISLKQLIGGSGIEIFPLNKRNVIDFDKLLRKGKINNLCYECKQLFQEKIIASYLKDNTFLDIGYKEAKFESENKDRLIFTYPDNLLYLHCHIENNTEYIKKAKKSGKLKKLDYVSSKVSPIVPVKVNQIEKEKIKEENCPKHLFPYNRLVEINEYEKNKIREERNGKY